ncbi:MAG: hypothetical protein JJ975_03210 [Bacteroidia bacterium]|nr:hypothetical protein [Bacteroidia bacterium]
MQRPVLLCLVLFLTSTRGEAQVITKSKDSLVLTRANHSQSVVIRSGDYVQLILRKQPNPKAVVKGVKGDSILFSQNKELFIKHLGDVKRIRHYNGPMGQLIGKPMSFVGKQTLTLAGTDILLGTFYSIREGFDVKHFLYLHITVPLGLGFIAGGNRLEAKSYKLHSKWIHYPTNL